MSDEETMAHRLQAIREALRIARTTLRDLHPWYCEDHMDFNQPCGCKIQEALDKTKGFKC